MDGLVPGRLAVGPARAAIGHPLNAGIPWDVEVVGGAGKLQGKLTAVDLRSFELTGGVDQLRLTLGQPAGDVPIRLTAGVNNVRIERPAGVHVRLNLRGGAGRIDFDEQRMNGAGDTVLETTGATSRRPVPRRHRRWRRQDHGHGGRLTPPFVAPWTQSRRCRMVVADGTSPRRGRRRASSLT